MVLLKKRLFLNKWVLVILVSYIALSVIKIEHPAINNDQLMFVNSATFNPDNSFLWKSFHGFPVMIFPYIGALKSYLYMPIFYLFGVNIWSVRLPQIILMSVTWFIVYKTLSLCFSKKLAVLTILLLSLDPSMIVYSKTDQGPTVLEFFLKTLTVLFLYLFLTTKRGIFYFGIYPILALGIFNKLNFIWFANAFMISFVIFYWHPFYDHFRKMDKLFPFLIFGIPYAFLVKIFFNISREVTLSYKDFTDPVSISNAFNNLVIFYNNLVNIINGNSFFKIVYGYNPTTFGSYFSALILLILLLGSYYIIRKHIAARAFYFFLFIVILTMLQAFLTKQAVSAWHVLSIYPFFTVILAASLLQLDKIVRIRLLKHSLTFFIIVAIILYQLVVNYLYLSQYSKPTQSIAYSAAIYNLINYVKSTQAHFICLDVDICNQLSSFTQQVGKFEEPFFFLDQQTYNYSFIKLTGNFAKPDKFLYIAHSNNKSHFPKLKESFFKYLKEGKVNFSMIKEFRDGENIAFEVYKISIFL